MAERSAGPSLVPYLTRPPGEGSAQPDPRAPLLPRSEAVRVGLLLPLSGPDARLGQAMLDAAQLALFDFGGRTFELLVHDTVGTPEGAAEAAALAIGDGATLILGPLFATSVRAVAPAARAAAVPVLAFSNNRAVAGDGVYVMGFLPEAQVERVVAYARSRGLLRFAVLAPDDPYGQTVIETVLRTAESVGATVTEVRTYYPGATDLAPVVRGLADFEARSAELAAQRAALQERGDEIARRALARLENLRTLGDLPFDALLIAARGDQLQAIAAHLPFFDVDPSQVRMLGTAHWDRPNLGAEPALVGGWFAAPPPRARAGFEQRFAAVYGAPPPRLATIAYDVTALAAVLAQGEDGRHFGATALTAASGYAGRDGIFRLNDDGTVERGLAVLEVQQRGTKVISAPPEVFAQPTN